MPSTPTFATRLDPQWVRRIAKTPPPWGPLGYFTYKRTYSRNDEQLHETLERCINAVLEYGGRFTIREAEQLFLYCYQLECMPGGRMLWQLGTPTVARLGGDSLFNCFTGDTEFLADDVPTRFDAVVGRTVKVRDLNGRLRSAAVNGYGAQPVNAVTFKVVGGSKFRQSFRVTADHRWILADGSVTTKLKVGDRVRATPCDVGTADARGFAHGLVFGDGTRNPQYPDRHMIRLCGDKAKHAARLRALPEFRTECEVQGDPFITLVVPGCNWKALPDESESAEYKTSFLAGWLAADGSVRPGQTRLFTTDAEAVRWVKRHAGLLGCLVTGESADASPTNFGPRTSPLVTLNLRFDAVTYVVESIVAAGEEQVYCVEEPVTKSFTLAGGIVTGNCWWTETRTPEDFCFAFDRSMLGGGVGFEADGSRLPVVRGGVTVTHVTDAPGDFSVPDSREGWVELLRRVYRAFFETGKGFSYDTRPVRPAGSPILGFGGTASGPGPLIEGVEKLVTLLSNRADRRLSSVDVVDVHTIQGEIVKSGNVRRTALIGVGDPGDLEYLRAKRWDLHYVPDHRAYINLTVAAGATDELPADYWHGFDNAGEQFGLMNARGIHRAHDELCRRWGLGARPRPTGVNPCAEIGLTHREPCCLVELYVSRLRSLAAFEEAARLLYRVAKTCLQLPFADPETEAAVRLNQRIGVGVTGIRGAEWTDADYQDVYLSLRAEDRRYSREIGANESTSLTTVKPSGTLSLLPPRVKPGVHGDPSEFFVRRIRIATGHPLIEAAKAHGYYVETALSHNGNPDPRTQIVSFPVDGGIRAGDAVEQLEYQARMQRVWSDNCVSVTVTFRDAEVPAIKAWLAANYADRVKTTSFMRDVGHGFVQTPYEPISADLYRHLSHGTRPMLDVTVRGDYGDDEVGSECAGGACPSR